jgi:hypothetical protein
MVPVRSIVRRQMKMPCHRDRSDPTIIPVLTGRGASTAPKAKGPASAPCGASPPCTEKTRYPVWPASRLNAST